MRFYSAFPSFSAVAICLLMALPSSVQAQPLDISFVEARLDGEESAPLANPEEVAISPDGRHVYVASRFATTFDDDGVAILALNDETGELSFIEGVFFSDGFPVAGAVGITVSPDGAHVYVASELSCTLSVFDRDAATGLLAFVEATEAGVGDVPDDALGCPNRVAISADGANVYASADFDSIVTVLDRNASTGTLGFVQGFENDEGGVTVFGNPAALAVSPDGAHVYVTDGSDHSIVALSRDVSTGTLTIETVVEDGVGGVTGLRFAEDVAISPSGSHVYVAGSGDGAVVVFSRDASSGALTFVEAEVDGAGGVDGLAGATGVAVSPDGAYVYVTSNTDNAVAVFSRDGSTGALTFVEQFQDGTGGANRHRGAFGIAISPDGERVVVTAKADQAVTSLNRDAVAGTLSFGGSIDDGDSGLVLRGGLAVATSPDGNFVYVAAGQDSGVTVFQRDGATGALEFVQALQDDTDGVNGLGNPSSIVISEDGAHVYFAAAFDNAVSQFSRDAATGMLAFVEIYEDGVGGVDGVNRASGVALSSDERHIYATGGSENAVAVFSRDIASGALTFVEVQRDGVGGVDGLHNPTAVDVSPDGAYVYVAGRLDDAVAVFSRNVATGTLTFVEVVRDGVGGVDGLDAASGVVVSPDGENLYVTGAFEDALAVFSRDASTGVLTFVEVQRDNTAGVDGLDAPFGVVVSPDGSGVFVASAVDGALAVFSRDPVTGALTFDEAALNGVNGVEGLAGARAVAISPDGRHEYVAAFDDDAVAVLANSRAVPMEDGAETTSFLTLAAWPNPTASAVTVSLSLAAPALSTSVVVYDALGRRVAVLHEGPMASGTTPLEFDASALPSGVYLVQALIEAGSVTQSLTVVR